MQTLFYPPQWRVLPCTCPLKQHPLYGVHIKEHARTMRRLSQCKYMQKHTPTARCLISHTVVLINKPNMPEDADRL